MTTNEARAREFFERAVKRGSEIPNAHITALTALLDSIEREAVADHHGKGDCGACNSISLAAAHVARNDLRRLAGLQPFGSPGNEETFRDIIAADKRKHTGYIGGALDISADLEAFFIKPIREKCGHSCIPTEIGCVVCVRSEASQRAIEEERKRVLGLTVPYDGSPTCINAEVWNRAIMAFQRAIKGE